MTPVRTAFLIGLLCLSHALGAVASPKKAPPPGKPAAAEAPKPAEPAAEAVAIAYLSQAPANPPTLPYFLARPADAGMQGARLGIVDNNTTGRFTRQNFTLQETLLPADADAVAAFKQLLAQGHRHILADLPAETLAALAKLPEAGRVLIYNVASPDDRLRGADCSANLLHLPPSRAMRADALMQYLSKKRWQKVFLVVGPEEADKRYAEAVQRAAPHFGVKIAAEKPWQHSFDARRTPESEIPVFTQGVDYDVLVVADEAGVFGDLLAYRTWQPRPVAGTAGLVPSGWHFTHEQWGALQLQNRFREQARRAMGETDYAAWLAVRAVGEAASRIRSTDFDTLKAFLRGGEFALAGFKGVPLSFRAWDGQLRQPVLLAAERSLVAVAPIEGFLHQKNELDTLGYDQSETQCHLPPPGAAP
jgi:ABC transporter substrate binding protein (PQQ-dependent alcohol dehydrogenase system)